MGFRKTNKNRRQDLVKRVQESIEDTGGFSSIIDLEKAKQLSSNDNIKTWRMKEGEHLIDIIPFIAGENHPKTPVDELAYNVGFWAHYNVGPNNDSYACPIKTWGKSAKVRCPICEYISKMNLKETDEELYDKIKARRRTAYLVWVHDSDNDEDAGIQILDVAHFFLEEKLREIAKRPRGGGSIVFSDYDEGKTIIFSRSGSGKGTRVVGHRFDDRPEPIPDDILDESFSLDEAMDLKPDFKEMYDSFYQGLGLEESEPEEEETNDDEYVYPEPKEEEYESDEGELETNNDYEPEPEPEPELEEEEKEEPKRKKRTSRRRAVVKNEEKEEEPLKRRVRRRK